MRFLVGSVALLCFAGCAKQHGEAIVLTKEHIAAAAPRETPTPAPLNETPSDGEQVRAIGDDEITVDGYVMKPEVRGTSRDPRALQTEQWLVKVRMIDDGRTFNVQTERAQFERLKEGDRVHVSYRVGKYTKTVWGAEITK